MFVLRERIWVRAGVERCFALATDVGLVAQTLRMRPVEGRTSGHVQGGDTVRWEGWQFGFPNYHVSVIEGWEPPFHFRDRMLAGRFREFAHDHWFREGDGGTWMEDELRFRMPLGWAGWLVGKVVVAPHVRRLLRKRFLLLKSRSEE